MAQRVRLERFRNYANLELELGTGFNVISGANGQGKTNFLEALHLIATTRLLRGQRDAEAIQDGSTNASVAVELAPLGTEISMRLERGTRKRASLNSVGLPRASDLLGRLPCVCVSAQDMAIVVGEPSERRMFLDLELSARSPAYLRHLTVYKRALEQRNAIVREARDWAQPDEVWEPWEDQLAEHGAALRRFRQDFVELLRPTLADQHSRIGGGEGAWMTYQAKDGADEPEELRALHARSRQSDVQRGSTSAGPHRDELWFEIGSRDARLFGSQGQQRTVVLALKLACLQAARELDGSPPLLLLDDIFSDLDQRRRANLVEIVLDLAGQAVLTCTESSAAGPAILDAAALFEVEAGTVKRVARGVE
jgi:DNA replication and repair protein RecF